MKPLRLTLCAFGSYADTLSIDFASLARHGVFAITGATGSGKSTIFDAIVYALYDDLPGFRVDGNVRSQYAAPATETWVDLEFEAAGERWHVRRTPTQSVPRRRGSGATVARASTVLLERMGAEGGGLTRKCAVAARIEQLVGLTKHQFEQVVLIPQGKFEEVLKADTRERSALLEQLFPVEVFARTTEQLRVAAQLRLADLEAATRDEEELLAQARQALRTIVEVVPDQVGHALTMARVADVEADGLASLLGEVEVVRVRVAEQVAGAKTAHEAAQAAVVEARDVAARWDRWQANVHTAEGFVDEELADDREAADLVRANQVATLAGPLGQWRAAVDEVERIGPAAADARRALAAEEWAPEDQATLDDATSMEQLALRIETEAAALAAAATTYDELHRQHETDEADQAALSQRQVDRVDRQGALHALVAALAADQSEHDDLAGTVERLAMAPQHVTELEARLVACRARLRARADADRFGAALDRAKDEEARARARALETFCAWRAGSAGRLAVHLADGHPCPTCGSTAHPTPARLSEDAPSDEMLAAADAATDAAVAARLDADTAHAAARATLATLTETADEAALVAGLAAARLEAGALGAALARRDALARAMARRVDEVERRRADLGRLDQEMAAAAATLATRRGRWQRDVDQFTAAFGGFVSPAVEATRRSTLARHVASCAARCRAAEDARTARDRAAAGLAATVAAFGLDGPAELTRWARPPDVIAAAEAALCARREHRQRVRHEIAEFEAGERPEARPEVAAPEHQLAAAGARHTRWVGIEGGLGPPVRLLAGVLGGLDKGAVRTAEARAAYEEVNALADLCAGRGSGTAATRLSLENWVLMDYLRRVLAQANARLAVMTEGRYSLELLEASTDGRKQFGLDLAAFDVNTGQSRPATTLSGGETFMAALALALGLADVVAGGAPHVMGALFVDEGFGSLDAEALDGVIEVLRSLEEGGRMVGVISHVEELKAALPNGIMLEHTTEGSVATVHYPAA